MNGWAKITIGQAFYPLLAETNREQVVGVEGNRGSAKTRSILSILMQRALRWPGTRWALWRSTRTRLSDTVMETLEEQVFPAFGIPVPGGKIDKKNRSHYKLPNGSEFVPIGMDDTLRTTSAEYAGGYLNEAVELDKLEDAEALLGSLRAANVPYNQLIIDHNPGPPGHWLNQKLEPISKSLRRLATCRADYDRLQVHNRAPVSDETKWKRILCGHEDNPGYFDLVKWELTELGQRYVKGTLGKLSAHLKRRWLHREWAAAIGSVYPDFDEELHTIDPFPIPEDWPIYWGYDAGFDHPTAILWFAVAPTGKLYVVHEHFMGGIGVSDDVEEITRIVRRRGHASYVREVEHDHGWLPRVRWGDPQHVFSSTAQAPESLAMQWGKLGFSLTPWPRTGGNEEHMVEAVRKRFGDGSMVIFKTCVNTIYQHQSWRYKRTAKGDLPPGEDAFEDKDNDTADVLKGVVAAGPSFDQQRATVYRR